MYWRIEVFAFSSGFLDNVKMQIPPCEENCQTARLVCTPLNNLIGRHSREQPTYPMISLCCLLICTFVIVTQCANKFNSFYESTIAQDVGRTFALIIQEDAASPFEKFTKSGDVLHAIIQARWTQTAVESLYDKLYPLVRQFPDNIFLRSILLPIEQYGSLVPTVILELEEMNAVNASYLKRLISADGADGLFRLHFNWLDIKDNARHFKNHAQHASPTDRLKAWKYSILRVCKTLRLFGIERIDEQLRSLAAFDPPTLKDFKPWMTPDAVASFNEQIQITTMRCGLFLDQQKNNTPHDGSKRLLNAMSSLLKPILNHCNKIEGKVAESYLTLNNSATVYSLMNLLRLLSLLSSQLNKYAERYFYILSFVSNQRHTVNYF